MAVDKSVAILDIMTSGDPVVSGLYPRRMGKSLFLGLLQDFLAVVATIPYKERRSTYKKYVIYEEDRTFFRNNMSRYPVFKLDLKEQSPQTRDEAAEQLHSAVVTCCQRHIEYLRDLLSGGNVGVGAHDIATVRERLEDRREVVAKAIRRFGSLKMRQDLTAKHLAKIGRVIPGLMGIFFWLLGRKSVVIVDKYDAPFVNILSGVEDRKLRDLLFKVYNNFLSSILKGNSYLRKGILAGVFDVRQGGMGSGLNCVVTYLAHAGIGSGNNPFQRAYGFTAQDTWGVIDRYVDKVWQGRDHCANAEKFKTRLFTGLLLQRDGYRIGSVHQIFCPLTVMSFLAWLNRGMTLEKLSFDKCRFWTDTGRLVLLQPIKPDSVDDLKRYISHLVGAFDWQAAYRRASDAVTRLQWANSLDAATIDQIASQPSEQNELRFGGDTEAELVMICTVDHSRLAGELLMGERLAAATVVQLFYQAGYLAPVSTGRMVIPCKEILGDIVWFYAKLAEDYRLNPNIRDAFAR